MKTTRLQIVLIVLVTGLVLVAVRVLGQRPEADDSQRIMTIDHYVRVQSTVPAIAGETSQIYVRERAMAGAVLRSANFADRVILFVHGGGTPAEVAFDVPYQDYSWMAYLAAAGFDVFAMDITGYGKSTRPAVMNDPCNLTTEQQRTFIPSLLAAPCTSKYTQQLLTIASDWNDIDAVVNYLRALRRVERVSIVGWSLGGPRAGGYAAQHPEKVQRLVLLTPVYNRMAPTSAPAKLPAEGVPMNTQSYSEFIAQWDSQVGCSDQYQAAVAESVWQEMLESDSVGATWGTGVRRAPFTTQWGWNSAVVGKMQTPTLMVSSVHDKQVPPERVRELYADFGAKEKVLIDLGCSSHNAVWESNHGILFRASVEWLTQGSVNGMKEGIIKLGY